MPQPEDRGVLFNSFNRCPNSNNNKKWGIIDINII